MRPIARNGGPRRRGRSLVGTAVLTLGLTGTVLGCGDHVPGSAPAPGSGTPSPSGYVAEDRRPTELTIAAIGVRTAVVPLGLNPDRTVEVPSDPGRAGWYRFGSVPGRSGSTVILGHVDSDSGPAVFYRLRNLAIGAPIDVRLADGRHARFLVDSIALYPNDRFPAAKVYRAYGPSRLILVTCGGGYDASRGGYQANLVVSARLSRAGGTGSF